MKRKEFEKLKELRIKEGYTYKQMADMLNVCKAFYWQIEHNNRRLYYNFAVKIAKIFNKKPDEIFYDYLK